MSLQKLSAGSGYEYLTRQVAALDSTEKASIPLADYYAAKGESPGRWVGNGLVGIDGLEAGDLVTSEQMKHLFGTGCDPVSGRQLEDVAAQSRSASSNGDPRQRLQHRASGCD